METKQGYTALIYSAKSGNENITKFLLEKSGIEVNTQDSGWKSERSLSYFEIFIISELVY